MLIKPGLDSEPFRIVDPRLSIAIIASAAQFQFAAGGDGDDVGSHFARLITVMTMSRRGGSRSGSWEGCGRGCHRPRICRHRWSRSSSRRPSRQIRRPTRVFSSRSCLGDERRRKVSSNYDDWVRGKRKVESRWVDKTRPGPPLCHQQQHGWLGNATLAPRHKLLFCSARCARIEWRCSCVSFFLIQLITSQQVRANVKLWRLVDVKRTFVIARQGDESSFGKKFWETKVNTRRRRSNDYRQLNVGAGL